MQTASTPVHTAATSCLGGEARPCRSHLGFSELVNWVVLDRSRYMLHLQLWWRIWVYWFGGLGWRWGWSRCCLALAFCCKTPQLLLLPRLWLHEAAWTE